MIIQAGRGDPRAAPAPPPSHTQNYLIHIDETGGDEPLVLFVAAATDTRALEVARDGLSRSPDHPGARASRYGKPLFDIARDELWSFSSGTAVRP